MRRKRFFSSIAFVLSLVMLLASGVMFVHSAQQQSTTSTLQVTFNGHHVNCSVEGWYQVKGDTQRTPLKNSTNGTKVTFSATEGSTEKTLEINNVASENKAILTSQKEYVLFTYKFTNTATDGAYGIEVSLTLDSISNSNLKTVKYGTSSSLYTNSSAGLGDQYDTLSSSSDTVFTDVFIEAGGDDTLATGTGIKYFYILLEVNDLTLPVDFHPDFTWTVESSSEVEEPSNTATLEWTLDVGIDGLSRAAIYHTLIHSSNVVADVGYTYEPETGNREFDKGTTIIVRALVYSVGYYLSVQENDFLLEINGNSVSWDSFDAPSPTSGNAPSPTSGNVPSPSSGDNPTPTSLGPSPEPDGPPSVVFQWIWTYTFTLNANTSVSVSFA